MKRAAAALRTFATWLSGQVGLEGAFLVTGTVALAIGAGQFHPAGPWLVVGAMCVVTGLALAVPRKAT